MGKVKMHLHFFVIMIPDILHLFTCNLVQKTRFHRRPRMRETDLVCLGKQVVVETNREYVQQWRGGHVEVGSFRSKLCE